MLRDTFAGLYFVRAWTSCHILSSAVLHYILAQNLKVEAQQEALANAARELQAAQADDWPVFGFWRS